jgi:hypothetical protein
MTQAFLEFHLLVLAHADARALDVPMLTVARQQGGICYNNRSPRVSKFQDSRDSIYLGRVLLPFITVTHPARGALTEALQAQVSFLKPDLTFMSFQFCLSCRFLEV